MSKNDGGPAFPVDLDRDCIEGMSLRDWFAVQPPRSRLSNAVKVATDGNRPAARDA